jgi:hypothetical protein
MKVYGVEITEEQIAAGIAAMAGDFTILKVQIALQRAGVPRDGAVASRAADRLLQRERKAGRIVAVNNRNWTATKARETGDA